MVEPSPRSLPATGGLSFAGRLGGGSLRWAFLLSLLTHLLLVLGDSPWASLPGAGKPSGGVLKAELRAPVAQADVPARQSQSAPVTAAKVATNQRSASVRGAAPRRQLATSSEVSAAALSGADPAAGVSEETRSWYRLALARQVRALRSAREGAQPQGVAGVVLLSLAADSASSVPRVLLERSSGHSPLDEAALSMVSRAVQQVPLPTELQGRRWRDALTIRFSPAD